MLRCVWVALLAGLLCGAACAVGATHSPAGSATPQALTANGPPLREAFAGAQVVDLRTSEVTSVVALRDKVGISASPTPVLVKTFDRNGLPEVLRPMFANPRRAAVTINGRYIAILHAKLRDEYADLLRHELVHAYITLASPKPLPSWFQEGSAVHYSMGKDRKFYGQPSDEEVGMIVGKVVELPEDYKQKLQTFNYVLQTSGEKKFNRWYRQAVESGNVDPRPLLGLDSKRSEAARTKHRLPAWVFGGLAGVAIVVIAVVAYFSSKRGGDYY